MAEALITMVDMVEVHYDELYGGQEEADQAVDQGFARGIFHSKLEGLREGIRCGLEQQSKLPW